MPPAPMRSPLSTARSTPDQMLDAEFLAGFIALRRLNDPAAATRHFTDARRAVQGGDHPGPRALLARPRRRCRGRRSEAGIPARRRLADHLLWPACRAGAGRGCRGAGAPHQRAARPRLDARSGAGVHRPRGGARRRDAGRLGRSAPGACLPAADGRAGAGSGRPRLDGAARTAASGCPTRRCSSPAAWAGTGWRCRRPAGRSPLNRPTGRSIRRWRSA